MVNIVGQACEVKRVYKFCIFRLYNDSPVRDTIVTNDRWGFGTACHHGDFYNCQDRYNPGILQAHKWENAFTLDKSSWGQRFDVELNDFMTSEELIGGNFDFLVDWKSMLCLRLHFISN